MWRPHTLAEVADRIDAGEDHGVALAELLDTFYFALQREGRAAAQACITATPRTLTNPLADPRLHAYLGAVGEHLSLRWGLQVPAWTNDPTRFLRRPWFTAEGLEGLKAISLAQSPTAFRRRMIFTEAEPLRRARLPRGAGGRALEAWEIGATGVTRPSRAEQRAMR